MSSSLITGLITHCAMIPSRSLFWSLEPRCTSILGAGFGAGFWADCGVDGGVDCGGAWAPAGRDSTKEAARIMLAARSGLMGVGVGRAARVLQSGSDPELPFH